MKSELTISRLISSAKDFCKEMEKYLHTDIYGATDGKAVGTYVEKEFKDYLNKRYDFEEGNSASGLDLPSVNCDIKVTSISQPQSSCPYRNSKQKIYGLGYNLMVFVYEKNDIAKEKAADLVFKSCVFIDSSRTADYQTTRGILDILDRDGNADDIFAYLIDRNIPGDEVTLYNMAEQIVRNPPELGYLTISNALQWRLQYGRVVGLTNINGIRQIIHYDD